MKAKIILTILCVIVTRTVSEVCDYEYSVELTNRTYNGITYKEGEYFVDNTTGLERGCVCKKEICIRKCCPLQKAYDLNKKECVDFFEEFNPSVYRGSTVVSGFNATKEFHLLINESMLVCAGVGEVRILVSSSKDYRLETVLKVKRYELPVSLVVVIENVLIEENLPKPHRVGQGELDNVDGQLYFEMENRIPSQLVYGPNRYCADNFFPKGAPTNEAVFNALICFLPEPDDHPYALNATCMLISCFFIILTVAVYSFLPELRTLHGMVMITYLSCFLVAFLFLATMDILLLTKNISQNQCTGMTFVIYFALLAAFFWLNVMCFDLWSKLSITNMAHGFSKSKHVRFMMYSAYAFGVPTALTILVAVLEFSDLPGNSKLLPNLRRQGCFIYGISKLLYLYTPIILICAANLVLFILTALRIAETKKQTQMLKKKDTQRLSLYIKLFIVTGINWILEVISSLFPKLPYLWQFTDAYNILIGLIIFIIFICKKKILKAIKKRYKELMGVQQTRTNTNTTTTSSNYQSEEDIQMQSK